MKTQITKIGSFKGLKLQMSNTTVKKYIDSRGVLQYIIFRGKGTGSSQFMTTSWEDVVRFNDSFKNLEYKTIYSNRLNEKGGAWFLNGEIFSNEHPFIKTGGYHF
jgi:hypothetical protein